MNQEQALKRRISDVVYRHLIADAHHRVSQKTEMGPGGQSGTSLDSSVAGSHPETPALRVGHSRTHYQHYAQPSQPARANPPRPKQPLDTKRHRSALFGGVGVIAQTV
jgi:hypothetical protein